MSKTVLITGSASGIGRATAAHFSNNGWRVIGIDREEQDDSIIYLPIRKDLSDRNGWEEVDHKVQDNLDSDGLLAIVHCAAIQIPRQITDYTNEELDASFQVNVFSVFQLLKMFKDQLQQSGGSVVLIGSVHSFATSANMAAYAATKGAIHTLTRSMAIDLAEAGIRVNSVAPGAVDTPMLRAGLTRGRSDEEADEQQALQQLADHHLHGKIGQPVDIAKAVYFLTDNEQSRYISGQTLVVDGGALIKLSTE